MSAFCGIYRRGLSSLQAMMERSVNLSVLFSKNRKSLHTDDCTEHDDITESNLYTTKNVNLPGGGLSKLQNAHEEVYFCEQQQILIQRLKDKLQNSGKVSPMTEEETESQKKMIDEYIRLCSSPHLNNKDVDVREEGYFYHEQLEDLEVLRRREMEKDIEEKESEEPEN